MVDAGHGQLSLVFEGVLDEFGVGEGRFLGPKNEINKTQSNSISSKSLIFPNKRETHAFAAAAVLFSMVTFSATIRSSSSMAATPLTPPCSSSDSGAGHIPFE